MLFKIKAVKDFQSVEFDYNTEGDAIFSGDDLDTAINQACDIVLGLCKRLNNNAPQGKPVQLKVELASDKQCAKLKGLGVSFNPQTLTKQEAWELIKKHCK